jgi:O-antigen/teichoic acid export membrane protein
VLFAYNIFFLILIARALSPQQYGYYVVAFSVFAFLDMFSAGLFNLATVKFTVDASKTEASAIFSTVVVLKLLMVAVYAAIIFLFSNEFVLLFNAPQLTPLLRITPIIGLVTALRQTMQQVVIARQELRGLLFSDVFGFICSFIVLLCVMAMGLLGSASDALLMFALSNLFFVMGMMLLMGKLIKVGRPSAVWARELSGFGKFSVLTSFSSYLLERIDGFLILFFLSPAALGAYDAARKISEGIIRNVVNTFSVIAYPAAVASRNDVQRLKDVYEGYSALLFFTCLPICASMIILPRFVLTLAYGSKYVDASSLLVIFAVGSLFRPFAQIGGNVFDGIGKPNLTFLFTFVGAIFAIVCNVVFIPRYGVISAAAMSALFFVINSILLFTFLRRFAPVNLAGILTQGNHTVIKAFELMHPARWKSILKK